MGATVYDNKGACISSFHSFDAASGPAASVDLKEMLSCVPSQPHPHRRRRTPVQQRATVLMAPPPLPLHHR
jgi:hypothetical protein